MKKVISSIALIISVVVSFAVSATANNIVIDFNELIPPSTNMYWNGSDLSGGL